MAEKKKRTLNHRSKSSKVGKSRRLSTARTKAAIPLKKASRFGKKEYHPVKLPDNKAGRLLSKRVNLVPRYLRESWAEIKQVTWPTRRETVRLTIAVLIFSIIFTVIVAVLDFGLDKIFKELIVK